MAKRRITPERAEFRKQLGTLMAGAGIQSMEDIQELFREMIGEFVDQGLEGELDEQLGYSKYDYRNKGTDNSRNGHSEKTLKTSYGDVEIQVPRDRKGEFEPELIKKQQTTLSGDIEEKILSMYAKGMTTADIEAHIREIYGLSVSDSTISRITDKILPVVKEWQARPLQEIYAVVYMDAVHFHVRSEGQIVKKAVYLVLGLDMKGRRDVLRMYISENESAKFWFTVLNNLKNRGVESVIVRCCPNAAHIISITHRTQIGITIARPASCAIGKHLQGRASS